MSQRFVFLTTLCILSLALSSPSIGKLKQSSILTIANQMKGGFQGSIFIADKEFQEASLTMKEKLEIRNHELLKYKTRKTIAVTTKSLKPKVQKKTPHETISFSEMAQRY